MARAWVSRDKQATSESRDTRRLIGQKDSSTRDCGGTHIIYSYNNIVNYPYLTFI